MVSGILDWEEAYWMPFGMNTCRISELAANNRLGVLSKSPYSDDMETAFWQSLFRAAPTEVRGLLEEVQLAEMPVTAFELNPAYASELRQALYRH